MYFGFFAGQGPDLNAFWRWPRLEDGGEIEYSTVCNVAS